MKWKYVIPIGHIELGKKMKEGFKIEAKKETSIDLFEIRFVGVKEFIFGKEF